MKPHIIDQKLREKRQKAYMAAPSIDEQYPSLEQIVVELQFSDPEGRENPSPQNRIVAPGMQAYFDYQCPIRDCNGGFDLSHDIPKALGSRKAPSRGTATCNGKRPRPGTKILSTCGLELAFNVKAQSKSRAAA